MKVKIKKCSQPDIWYADWIDTEYDEFEIEFVDLNANNLPDSFVAKTWNWFYNRTEIQKIMRDDCEIIDTSGSVFEDGYQLGVVHGKELEQQRLIKEGILEADPDADDEPLTLHI